MQFAGKLEPGVSSGIVTYAQYVQGSYVVVQNEAERNAIIPGVLVNGTPVYIAELQKLQRWNGTAWVDEEQALPTAVGYYYNGDFYKDNAYTQKIGRAENRIYIDKDKNEPYFFNGTAYKSLQKDLTEVEAAISNLQDEVQEINGKLLLVQAHIEDATIHVTAEQKAAWTAKQDKIDAEHKLSADLIDGLPKKTSDLTNDGDGTNPFITKVVSDLVNYYTKSNVYTKAEVDALIAVIPKFEVVVVDELPEPGEATMNKLYLLKIRTKERDYCDEYVTVKMPVEGGSPVYRWEKIGSTDIDLSEYAKITYVDTKVGEVSARTTTLEGLLDGHTVRIDVPADAKFTDTIYDDTALKARVATIESKEAGWDAKSTVSVAAEKTEGTLLATLTIDGVPTKIYSDTVPTKTSDLINDSGFLTEHQSLAEYRKSADQDVIDAGKQDKIDAEHKLSADYVSGLHRVATSGSYSDLSGTSMVAEKPYVDTTVEAATKDKADRSELTAYAKTADLAKVAFSGDYNDLINKPAGANQKVYQVVKNEDETDAQAIARILDGKTPANGDICIVKKLIASDKYEYTAYVYSGEVSSWVAMDGNYDAENVYFNQDLTYTAAIGTKVVPASGSGTISAKGKNIKAVLADILAKEVAGQITLPVVSVTLNKAGAYEAGTNITGMSYSATLSAGSYQYGPATGVVAQSWEVKDTGANTYTEASHELPDLTVVDNMNYYVNAKAKHNAGAWAKTNIGNQPTSGELSRRIEEGTKNNNSDTITSYRKTFFYVGTDATPATTSAIVRAATETYNGSKVGEKDLTIPAGTKRVTYAIPGAHTLASCKDIGGAIISDITSRFTTRTVSVAGASDKVPMIDYTVFEFINENGITATIFKFNVV